jgi:hypothetical protein
MPPAPPALVPRSFFTLPRRPGESRSVTSLAATSWVRVTQVPVSDHSPSGTPPASVPFYATMWTGSSTSNCSRVAAPTNTDVWSTSTDGRCPTLPRSGRRVRSALPAGWRIWRRLWRCRRRHRPGPAGDSTRGRRNDRAAIEGQRTRGAIVRARRVLDDDCRPKLDRSHCAPGGYQRTHKFDRSRMETAGS